MMERLGNARGLRVRARDTTEEARADLKAAEKTSPWIHHVASARIERIMPVAGDDAAKRCPPVAEDEATGEI